VDSHRTYAMRDGPQLVEVRIHPHFVDWAGQDYAVVAHTDGPTTYLRGTVWSAPAQNVAESLHKGDRVVVVGRLRQRDYETRDGEKRSTHELDIDEIGASLRYATADLHKATRNGTVTNNQPDDQPPI
jgi:single-stranded DNA-binding protein